MFERQRSAKALVAGAFSLGLLVAACGGTSPSPAGTSAGESAGATAAPDATAAPTEAGPAEPVTLTFLVNSGETNEAQAKALVDAFTAANPTITIETSLRPGGGDGDNLVKTKLATGEMEDLFHYNSGSLLQALTPDKTLTNVADQEWVSKLDPNFKTAVGTANGTYGAPWNTSMGGGVLYNKDIYAELGLQIPTTWDEFIANSEKIKAAGKAAPIIQTYGDTWTSQLWVLADFYNVLAQNPDWAQQYTENKAHYSEPPAFNGFSNLEQAAKSGLFNKDFASATYDDAIKMLATGTGAQYPMLTFAVQNFIQTYPDAVGKIGVFPLPGSDAAHNGLTVWMPDGVYIPKTVEGAKLDAAKKFQAFLATKEACDIIASKSGASGPFVVDGCTLPADVPPIVSDQQPYFDQGKTGLALEFLSPIKGPALEQIMVSIGSGISNAVDGAAQYDEDVKKQAQQLGLPGW